MDPTEIRSFVANYVPADERFIRFDWNGNHADAFEDRNSAFREAVLDAIEDQLDEAPLILIRDLYRAETQYSREAWCIDGRVGSLAERLLRRSGDHFVLDYLEGRSRSFDAHMGSAFKVDLPLAELLLNAVRDRLQTETDELRRDLLRNGEEMFEGWVAYCRSNGS